MSADLVPVTAADLTASPALHAALLALNNANAVELSWLEPDRLQQLVAAAFLAKRIGEADAFLLAFDQEADYDSPNFLWFRARYPRFVYVDRIVVAAHARGHGHARRLYLDLFARALQAGHDQVVCEINSNPPNLVSDAFHAELGFTKVGMDTMYGGSKTVSYLARPLTPQ